MPVTDREVTFGKDERIVSTTDLKGLITSVNDTFVRISGFERDELIGKSHNVVRHPSMPPLAFENLWQTMKSGRPWIGLVKNRCKNGDYYWVHAYVSPIYEGESIVGYQSVRYPPSKEQIARAEKLYGIINKHDGNLGLLGNLLFKFNYTLLNFAIYLLVFFGLAAIGALTGVIAPWVAAVLAIIGFPVGAIAAYLGARPVARLRAAAKRIADNDLLEFVYSGNGREIATVEHAMLMLQSKLNTAVGRLELFSTSLYEAAEKTKITADASSENARKQEHEIVQVATAMNEMNATVEEIARNASTTADQTKGTQSLVEGGSRRLNETSGQVTELAHHVDKTGKVIDKLNQDFKEVDSVLQLIVNISEQTNLLALNAAIEAARAGEHGRGFSVVADEVRTLANKTKESTSSIKGILTNLSASMQSAVTDIQESEAQMHHVVEQIQRMQDALGEISSSAAKVADMNMQIASAAQEQSMVVEEINRNVSNISEIANYTALSSQESTAAADDLNNTAKELGILIKQVTT